MSSKNEQKLLTHKFQRKTSLIRCSSKNSWFKAPVFGTPVITKNQ